MYVNPPLERPRNSVRLVPTMSQISRGELYWLKSAGARGEADVAHPYVVVQEDVFNRSRIETVVVCALTSNLKRATEPGNVLLEPGEAGLPKQSVVIVSQIDSVKKSELGAPIGALSEARIQQILAGLRFQQRAYFRED